MSDLAYKEEPEQNSVEEIKISEKKPYKRRWGDRIDGRRLRSLDPITNVIPFIMKARNDSQNLIKDYVDIENINKFVHKMRREGYDDFGAMHVFIAAYVRMVSQRPAVNRFINGQRIYARHNIEVILAVKKQMALDAEETMVKFFFEPDATVIDVYNEMNKKISEIKDAADEDTSFDSLVGFFGKIPRFILRGTVSFLEWLDYHGWIPRALTLLSPFHGSLVVTSMASLGIPPIYHHLYNFGNVPMFMAFSATRHENVLERDGSVKRVRYFDFSITTDERICDGFYYASAFKVLKKHLVEPELLLNPPETVIEDVP